MSRNRQALAGALAIALAAALLLVWSPWSGEDRVEQLKGLVTWPNSCADVVISETKRPEWPQATREASVICEHLGPGFHYARFETRAALEKELLRAPPPAATCLAGLEVIVDFLDPGQFAALCAKLRGELVDAVSGLPESSPPGRTVEEIDRQVEEHQRRAVAAQRRALTEAFRASAAR